MDGHQNEWSHKLIAKMIMNNIEMLNIDTVITFDEMGVSEHPNHIAIFDAMAYLTLNHVLPSSKWNVLEWYPKIYLSYHILRRL